MKIRKIAFKLGKKDLFVDGKVVSKFSFGLMFRGKNTNALLFEFSKDTRLAISSLFCFHSFLAVWLDSRGQVLEFRVVKPFEFSINPEKPFRKLVEIPFNAKYRRVLENFLGVRNI